MRELSSVKEKVIVERFKHEQGKEFALITVLKLKECKVNFLFLQRKGVEILKAVAMMRSCKLSGGANPAPVMAYYPQKIGKKLYEELPQRSPLGEIILSPESRVNYVLRRTLKRGPMRMQDSTFSCQDHLVKSLLQGMQRAGDLYIFPEDAQEEVEIEDPAQLVPVSELLGFPSNIRYEHEILFNTSFFLLEASDTRSYHSLVGEPYGLVAIRGRVSYPPLSRRGALLWSYAGPSFERISLFNTDIYMNGNKMGGGIFTREYGECSPPSPGRVHLAVVGTEVVAYKEGGRMEIPDAGFALEAGEEALRRKGDPKIRYSLPDVEDLSCGIQAGPLIMPEGETGNSLLAEDFSEVVPPTVFPRDWDETPAARMVLGTTAAGELVVVGVEGSSGVYTPGLDSRGLTLKELSAVLHAEGVKKALNLDGGGSAYLSIAGGSCLRPAARLDPWGCGAQERPVPLVAAIEL